MKERSRMNNRIIYHPFPPLPGWLAVYGKHSSAGETMLQLNRQCLKGHCLCSGWTLRFSLISKKEGVLYPDWWVQHHKSLLKGKQMLHSIGWRRWFRTSLAARTKKFTSGVNVGTCSLSSPAAHGGQEHVPSAHEMVASWWQTELKHLHVTHPNDATAVCFQEVCWTWNEAGQCSNLSSDGGWLREKGFGSHCSQLPTCDLATVLWQVHYVASLCPLCISDCWCGYRGYFISF